MQVCHPLHGRQTSASWGKSCVKGDALREAYLKGVFQGLGVTTAAVSRNAWFEALWKWQHKGCHTAKASVEEGSAYEITQISQSRGVTDVTRDTDGDEVTTPDSEVQLTFVLVHSVTKCSDGWSIVDGSEK